MGFKFEKLKIWQKALHLSVKVDALARSFPKEEKYVLASQIKRASDSVTLNIAEGSTGQSDKEFARFLSIANRSAIEVVACLHVGLNRKIIEKHDFDELYKEYESLVVGIQALRKTLLRT